MCSGVHSWCHDLPWSSNNNTQWSSNNNTHWGSNNTLPTCMQALPGVYHSFASAHIALAIAFGSISVTRACRMLAIPVSKR